MKTQINFWGHKQEYYPFSNFCPAEFVDLAGRRWPTSEHYYQAKKFQDKELQEKVRLSGQPRNAANMGRDTSLPLRKDWEEVKELAMWNALCYKFDQHEDLRYILLQTGTMDLVEDSPIDYYWGCGKDRSGRNRLGVLLMRLRHEIRQDSFMQLPEDNPFHTYEWKEPNDRISL